MNDATIDRRLLEVVLVCLHWCCPKFLRALDPYLRAVLMLRTRD